MSSVSLPWPLRRAVQREKRCKEVKEKEAAQLEELGLTTQLLEFLCDKITMETFKSFHLQGPLFLSYASQFSPNPTPGKAFDANSWVVYNFASAGDQIGQNRCDASSLNIVDSDLSEWQERHAMLLLSKSKEISQIRYALCPRYMKDNQFWRIYFLLVKNYVAPYEMRAIQEAKLKTNMEEAKSSPKVAIEVELMESKISHSSEAPLHTNGRSCRGKGNLNQTSPCFPSPTIF